MTITQKAIQKVLEEFSVEELKHNGDPTFFLDLFTSGKEIDMEFVKEISKLSVKSVMIGKPLCQDFLQGILFYHLFLKYKQIEELEEMMKKSQ